MFATTSGTYFQYLPTYLTGQLRFDASLVFTANVTGVIAFVVGMPAWGMLRDRFGWAGTIGFASVLNAAVATWFFHFLQTLGPTDARLIFGYIVVGLCGGCVHAVLAGLIPSLFPTAIRQSGFAFPYSIGTAVFTGLTPLTLAWLVRDFGLFAPLYQYLLGCIVALAAAAVVRFMPQYLGGGPPARETVLPQPST